MPNSCDNTLDLTHEDPAMIERAKNAFKENKLLSEFCPCPKPLYETVSGYIGEEGSYERKLNEFKQQLNVEYFGHKNWYDWCVNEWGTKWDIGEEGGCINQEDPNSISFSFQSAWSPPTGAYAKLVDMGFEVYALYYESGMGFCGCFDQGIDDCYSIDGNSESVKDSIPDYIDEAFCISESMAEWEEENREEEDVSN